MSSAKKLLIAQALWGFVAEDRVKSIERQSPSDVDDMELILDQDYPNEVATLIRLEKFKGRA